MTEYPQPIDRIRAERKAAALARMRRRRLIRLVTGVVVAVLLVGAGLGFVFSDDAGESRVLPGVGDHWHAEYSIEVDGEALAAFPASEGDVHSHGDGRVHIHPHSVNTAYEAATLGAFFASVGGELTNDTLRLPDGRSFGQTPAADLQVLVNGQPITAWSTFVPQDGDRIEIVVTSEG
jgi:hypothetical protein